VKVLKFYSTTCEPCRRLDAQLERVFPDLDVAKVNTDVERELTRQYMVRSIPTLILLDLTGEEQKRLTGSVTDAKLKEFFE